MSDAPRFDLLLTHARIVSLDDPEGGYGEIADGAIGCRDGRIAWLGRHDALPAGTHAERVLDAHGRLLTPGLIDCHTHLVFGGVRADEFEMRLEGASYQDIARAGGGIASSVAATRAADEDSLFASALPRARSLLHDGVTTIEIKSGYGLDLDSERRMLRVARRLGEHLGISVRTSFLGLHALPTEFADDRDGYVSEVCERMLPALAAEGLVDAVDAFCENIAFSPAQIRRLFEQARALQLPVKLHAEQLSNQHGAALVAEFDGLSADHLEYLDEAGVASMARAGTVAVLLPGAFYALRETRRPPIVALRDKGVPMAVATDLNPGTSPLLSLRLAANMACTLFGLTPAEALRGVTAHAARALGLDDRGRLRAGMRADMVLWNAHTPAELCYWVGGNLVEQVLVAGATRNGY
ncbi:imidazolonepropionase [Oleiagrimonas sp.]|jgi:imidazolonepropionase|uniref:imidazolonepropionase n=1 Tax=Oleiagrimonas sp. TaxID=2010330 RepID=UPI00261C7305|nr:imidazolonepropionase [Oleiagrimonas sp.]MDA3915195.1 imidazolonepropionase [Oleiagrimonas sp.]